jgi:hypothetical protein
MARDVDNSQDVIDSRDVIARIEELQAERDACVLGAPDGTETPDPEGWAGNFPEEAAELAALESLAEEAEGYAADWQHGEALIRDSYFTEYAEQLAEDCGMIKEGATWPNNCIDWERAARELQMDYTSVDFDGVTYWTR